MSIEKEEPERALYLLPSTRHVEAKRCEHDGQITARVFREFARDLCEALAPERVFAPPYASRLVIADALGHLHDGRVHYPSEPPARAALARSVDRSIGRLFRAGTTPAQLYAAGTPLATLLGDLLAHVDACFAARGLVDPRGAAMLAARRLRALPPLPLPELASGRCVVDGLCISEPDELALIEALHGALRAQGGAGVRLVLPRLSTPGDPFDRIADALTERWEAQSDAPEIARPRARSPYPVSVVASRDAEGEARATASFVLAALSRGTPEERMAVVVPALDEAHLEPLRAAFTEARVPFCEPRGRPASSCPEGRIALTLLAIASGPVRREQVIELFEVLRASGLYAGDFRGREGSSEGLARGMMELSHRLREVPVEIDPTGELLVFGLEELVTARAREAARSGVVLDEGWMPHALSELLSSARRLGTGSPGLREMVARYLALLDRLGLGKPRVHEIASAIRAGKRHGGLPQKALGEGAAALRALRASCAALLEAAETVGLAERSWHPSELLAELEDAMDDLGTGLGSGTAQAGAVSIGRATDLAGLEFELVWVSGLEAHAYGGEGEDLFVDERLRKRLPVNARPPSLRDRERFQSAALGLALGSAERVAMSYTKGEEGELTVPHRLIRWAKQRGVEPRREPVSRVSRSASRLSARGAELVALASGMEPEGEILARSHAERARMAFFLDPRAPASRFSGLVELADDAAARRLAACVGGDSRERSIAVTAIERAAGCAFAGFARRVLRLKRADERSESADAREHGTLVHRALQAAFEGAYDEGRAGGRAAQLAAARARAERALGALGLLTPLRAEAVAQAIHEALLVVSHTLAADEEMLFFAAERSFGGRSAEAPWEALALEPEQNEEDGATIYVDGQIDRVDLSLDRRRVRVVDYKTGRLPRGSGSEHSAFQLPLYAAVAQKALACQEAEAHYVAIRPRGIIEEWPRTAADRRALGARRDESSRAARRVILGLWQGSALPRPMKMGTCTRCEVRDVCRRPASAPLEEKDAPR